MDRSLFLAALLTARIPALLLALLGGTSVMADSGVSSVNNATLLDSGTQYRGNFSVNQAAGDQQQQANVRAIAIGIEAGATTSVRQSITTPANPSMDATANIGCSPFSNGNGLLGVNQSAGAKKQKANRPRNQRAPHPLHGLPQALPFGLAPLHNDPNPCSVDTVRTGSGFQDAECANHLDDARNQRRSVRQAAVTAASGKWPQIIANTAMRTNGPRSAASNLLK